MTVTVERYYKASGVAPASGIVLGVLAGAVIGALAGAVYGLIDYINPFIYVNALAAGGAGGLAGWAAWWGIRSGKLRSDGFTILIGLAAGAAALYGSWLAWLSLLISEATNQVILIWNPGDLLDFAKRVNVNGTWTIGGGGPVSGVFLWIIWAIEALLIVGAGTLVCVGCIQPFCELSGRWANKTDELARLQLADPSLLRLALEEERYEVLADLRPAKPGATQYLSLSMYVDPDGGDENYLTVQSVTETVDKDGKTDRSTTDVVEHLAVDAEMTARITSGEAFASPEAEPGEEEQEEEQPEAAS